MIAVEIQNPEFATLLNDIRDFDWKVVNRLRKEDLARIQSTGFSFKSKGIENQKQEFKTFLFEHPSVMASDLEMIIYKLNVFSRLIANVSTLERGFDRSGEQEPVHIEPTKTAITHQKKQKKSKKQKRKVIVIEEESSDEQYEDEESSNSTDESEDVEYVPVPYKRSRNSHKR